MERSSFEIIVRTLSFDSGQVVFATAMSSD
jgi:hypothetical protein